MTDLNLKLTVMQIQNQVEENKKMLEKILKILEKTIDKK